MDRLAKSGADVLFFLDERMVRDIYKRLDIELDLETQNDDDIAEDIIERI